VQDNNIKDTTKALLLNITRTRRLYRLSSGVYYQTQN